jgi:tetratricopeptide (TPR) repeat protein
VAVSFSKEHSVSGKYPRAPLLSALYRTYLDRQDLAEFTARVSERYTQGTLERLAEHTNSEMRRAAVAALGLLGDYSVNHVLGQALLDDDDTVRVLAEKGIRRVWSRAGSEEDCRELDIVIRLNTGKKYEQAIQRATDLIEKAPWFAEAWNQRAVARFALKQYAESIRDCHQTLEINPYHFPAASGMGHAYLRLNNSAAALECFRRALRLNPGLKAVRAEIDRLTRRIRGQ